MGVSLLHYRPWRGTFRRPGRAVWPVARTALGMIFRRRLFWVLYAFALLIFLMFFFGQYLLAWAEAQAAQTTDPIFGGREPGWWIGNLRTVLKLNGSAETYRNLFWWQGFMVVIVLALAGSILVGNDFLFNTLPFYLSKPIQRRHYLAGKCLAVGVFINLMTTLPALALFFQYGLLVSWEYFFADGWRLGTLAHGDRVWELRLPNPLFFGIIGYGLVLTVVLSLLLAATASWLRRTVPMIMAWTTLFFFARFLTTALVDGLQFDPRWRLFDVWNDTYLIGSYFLGLGPWAMRSPRQPALIEAAIVLGLVCALCLIYLRRRIRAVEIVY